MQRKYPKNPRIGVGALIKKGDKVVLVKRGSAPAKGLWSIPGGLLELGERLHEAVKREVKEETGIEIEVERLLDVIDNIVYDEKGVISYHYVLIDYLCHPVIGELQASADVEEAKWIKLKAINKLPITRTLHRLLDKV